MANSLQEVIKMLQQNGNVPPGGNASKGNSEWEKTLAQMAMAQKMDANTMSGFALGKLLRGVFDDWKANYNARGRYNNSLLDATPDKRAQMLQELQQKNPKQYERSMEFLAKNGLDMSGTNPQPQNPASEVAQEMAQGLLGNSEAWKQFANLDWEEKLRQMGLGGQYVDKPF